MDQAQIHRPGPARDDVTNAHAAERQAVASVRLHPSRVTDNRILLSYDPDILDRLNLWFARNCSGVAGGRLECYRRGVFPEFSLERHVIAPHALPEHWLRFRAMDWGSARPFSVGWYAVSDGDDARYPRGALIRYREWYGSTGEPNKGLRMTAEEVADGIKARESEKSVTRSSILRPLQWMADQALPNACRLVACILGLLTTKRTGQTGAMGGWDQVRARLRATKTGDQWSTSSLPARISSALCLRYSTTNASPGCGYGRRRPRGR